MKQLHDLNDKIVLIDWVGYYDYITQDYSEAKKEAIKSATPTLEQDKQTWLELSERCGGKLELNTHYKIIHGFDIVARDDGQKYLGSGTQVAIPAPQTEDLWEEAFTKCSKELYIDLDQVSMFIQVKEWFEKQQEFSLTRKS